MDSDTLFLKILKNEENYTFGDERQFMFDLGDCFSQLLNGYTPSFNLTELNGVEYNRMGYLLFIATLFFAKKNKNRELIKKYKQMTPRKTSGCFFSLETIPKINNDSLARMWNLTSSCHPIDVMKLLR